MECIKCFHCNLQMHFLANLGDPLLKFLVKVCVLMMPSSTILAFAFTLGSDFRYTGTSLKYFPRRNIAWHLIKQFVSVPQLDYPRVK